jgi:hypothetical protein
LTVLRAEDLLSPPFNTSISQEEEKKEKKSKRQKINQNPSLTPKSLSLLDDAFSAQARFDALRGLSPDFAKGFVEHCASDYPLLPGDLGATGLRAFRVDALACTAVREKSAVHRFVDNHAFLRRFFATVSPPWSVPLRLGFFFSDVQGARSGIGFCFIAILFFWFWGGGVVFFALLLLFFLTTVI